MDKKKLPDRQKRVWQKAMHIHPSGKTRPSCEDNALTKQIQDACKLMCIRLLDHIIVTSGNGYYSYYDEGKL